MDRTFPPQSNRKMEKEEINSPSTSSPSASNLAHQVMRAESDRREEMMEGVSRETQMSIAASSIFPGFRFSPTDVELISFYLQKKLDGYEKCVEVICEIDICRFEPWDLPAKSIIQSDNEWFFFNARGRKYPNGSQSKRATELGYWKATGKERNVKSGSLVIGTKRTLVFHIGRAPKGERTEWIMHEYCMNGKPQDSLVVCRLRRNNDFHLTDNSNNASPSQGHLPATCNSNLTFVDADAAFDQTGVTEVDKAGESCSRKCSSSSYDSHSIEQFDSASESEQKLSNEVTLAESSSRQKESDDEDFYADILKDDIVELDEILFSATPKLHHTVVTTKPEDERISRQPAQATLSRTHTSQGTANRRIKLRKIKLKSGRSHDLEKIRSGKSKNLNYEQMPKSLLGVLSTNTVNRKLVSVLFITMSLLVLLLPLWGGSKQIQRFTKAALNSDLWPQM
ncbi:NAC domain protein [Tripterygium wilfordii]|uniref:NAC domain protein n=1 Tax=Tripterygium wilfordii TaxID=458696 RepID=A0A7J7DEW6_TRIWF|nr:NAC domain-containing protein 60-like [Tripterygium wilfordii]KAF5744900.1 NAC domain protein [Tripterygium wilfordii]